VNWVRRSSNITFNFRVESSEIVETVPHVCITQIDADLCMECVVFTVTGVAPTQRLQEILDYCKENNITIEGYTIDNDVALYDQMYQSGLISNETYWMKLPLKILVENLI